MAEFHVDLKEAFALIEAAHNRALRERSDIKREFEGVTNHIDKLYNQSDDLKSRFTKLSLL